MSFIWIFLGINVPIYFDALIFLKINRKSCSITNMLVMFSEGIFKISISLTVYSLCFKVINLHPLNNFPHRKFSNIYGGENGGCDIYYIDTYL